MTVFVKQIRSAAVGSQRRRFCINELAQVPATFRQEKFTLSRLAHLGYIMGRVRSFVLRCYKPFAFAAVAMFMSLSLVVTTPSTAHALTVKQPVKAEWVLGAVKTVAPAALTVATSVSPVGWGIKLIQLGLLAYDTRDIWMPFVTGMFGQDTTQQPLGASPTGAYPAKGVSISTNPTVGTDRITGGKVTNTSTTTLNIYWNTKLNCKSSTGTITARTNTQNGTSLASGGGSAGINAYCNTGETLTGAAVYGDCMLYACASTYTGGRAGPTNVWTYGDLAAGTQGFDPRGNNLLYQGKSECIDSQSNISWAIGDQTPGDNGAVKMPSCEARGLGHGTGRTTVTAFKPDGSQQTVWDTGAKPFSDPATPLCDPSRPSDGCTLTVTKNGQPCTVGDVECENWEEDARNDTTGTKYGCKLGPYTLPLSSCALLEGAYKIGGSILNDPNTDGDPSTSSNQGPDGSVITAPAPTTTDTSGNPSSDPGAAGQPGAGAEPAAKSCWPNGWSVFNPMWIYDAINCAFVPQTDIKTRVSTLQATAQGKEPLSWLSPTIVGPGSSGCPNWVVRVGSAFSENIVCDSSFTAAILSVRVPLFGLLSAAMVWPLLRSLWYAAIPILRVTPSSGGKD